MTFSLIITVCLGVHFLLDSVLVLEYLLATYLHTAHIAFVDLQHWQLLVYNYYIYDMTDALFLNGLMLQVCLLLLT